MEQKMRVLIYGNQEVQCSVVSTGSCSGWRELTTKQFDKAAKKLEKQIEKRKTKK